MAGQKALGNAQDRAKRQRDYAIAITGLIYILNIVDAVVDAHLYESRHDPDLVLNHRLFRISMATAHQNRIQFKLQILKDNTPAEVLRIRCRLKNKKII